MNDSVPDMSDTDTMSYMMSEMIQVDNSRPCNGQCQNDIILTYI